MACRIRMPPSAVAKNDAGGMFSGRPSFRPCVDPCVRPRYKQIGRISPNLPRFGALADKDELIDFKGQKVKGQGHDQRDKLLRGMLHNVIFWVKSHFLWKRELKDKLLNSWVGNLCRKLATFGSERFLQYTGLVWLRRDVAERWAGWGSRSCEGHDTVDCHTMCGRASVNSVKHRVTHSAVDGRAIIW